MTIRKILTEPDKFLRQISKTVLKVTDEERCLMDDMLETMYDANGIGLAATQIGIDKRLIVMDCGLKADDDHLEPNPIKMINPEITFLSKNFKEREEGCLSIPGHQAIVKRPDKVIVNYRDENFKQKELKADDLLGVCIQHEIDHLNGILFIDHLSRIKKEMILKKIKNDELPGYINNNLDVNIVQNSIPEGGTNRRCPNISKLIKLGYKPKISIDKGLPEVIDFYLKSEN